MNSSGYIRGYMSKNMNAEDFIKVVVKALGREFEGEEVTLERVNSLFEITMKDYKVKISKEFIDELKSPYRIDRYILEEFESQGFTFERNRSQYFKYCFSNFTGLSGITGL